MYCGCQGRKRAEIHPHQDTLDSPLQIQLVKMLGLKNYLLDKFLFRRKTPTYSIHNHNTTPAVFFGQDPYLPPDQYTHTAAILEIEGHSVPVVRICPVNPVPNERLPCVIYAHGNSSDLGDGLHFISRLADKFRAQYIVFDYTGYGASRLKQVGEEVICGDLELVLAWADRPLSSIILWGFSLGSFPVVFNAARYNVKAVVLQCPIGSLSCMFYDEYAVNVKFKEDHFANIDHIAQVKAKVLMLHSTGDEIIPIAQARLLYSKYILEDSERTQNIDFIEVQKIGHNSFHRFIASNIPNTLQEEVLAFLNRISQEQPEQSSTGVEQRLLQLRGSVLEGKLQQFIFDESQFQLVETEQGTARPVGDQKWRLGWLCAPK